MTGLDPGPLTCLCKKRRRHKVEAEAAQEQCCHSPGKPKTLGTIGPMAARKVVPSFIV